MISSRGLGFQLHLIAFTAAFALVGCGSKTTSGITYYGYGNQIETENMPESQRAALRTFVYCDDKNCNPSVSMLIAITERSVGSCTASMIGEDIAVTNSHCIPEDLKEERSDCSNRIYLFFPKTNAYAAERAECAEVLRASEINPSGEPNDKTLPDFAFIRLKKPVSRPALSLSTDGFPNTQAYTIPKVDPVDSSTSFVGALRSTKCSVIYSSAFSPNSVEAQSAVTSFKACAIEHGNSGSPILDSSGKVRGVIQARFEPSYSFTSSNQSLDGDYDHLGLGTNLGCVSMPEILPERNLPNACTHIISPREADERAAKIAAALEKKLSQKAFALSRSSIPDPFADVFEWAIVSRPGSYGGTQVQVAPKCFKLKSLWIKNYEWLLGVKGSASEEFTVPVWMLKTGLNQYAQVDARIDDNRYFHSTVELKFSPKDFNNSGASRVTYTEINNGIFNSDTVLLNYTLRACPTVKK